MRSEPVMWSGDSEWPRHCVGSLENGRGQSNRGLVMEKLAIALFKLSLAAAGSQTFDGILKRWI